MYDGFAVRQTFFVVPVHDLRLARAVEHVLGNALVYAVHGRAQLAAQSRIGRVEQIVVALGDQEQIAAVLNVAHAGLPEKVQEIDRRDPYVTPSVLGFGVPEDTVTRRTVTELGVSIARV